MKIYDEDDLLSGYERTVDLGNGQSWAEGDMENIFHVVDHFAGLLKALYETGSKEDIDFHVEEMAWGLGLPFNYDNLPIDDKASKSDRMNFLLGYQRCMLDMQKLKKQDDFEKNYKFLKTMSEK